ncbi:hypothetical protein BOTBODRAFT_182308 [Botryobasidium botryosum FD-172 SS1]|uniref:Uncharacterized protein n=1 Tax=Botryobasidium botryosum (strain FD-172 SS1) TaxID=930990 RepID=A0A067M280_BOTB1|nr:hypothetical protein BOTBODRAFT_182308 [Botryobasidium botryosum FD-172 SS1]
MPRRPISVPRRRSIAAPPPSITMPGLQKSMLEWLITNKKNCTVPTLFTGRWSDLHGAITSHHEPPLRVKVTHGSDGLIKAKLIDARNGQVYIPCTSVGDAVDIDAICDALYVCGLGAFQ